MSKIMIAALFCYFLLASAAWAALVPATPSNYAERLAQVKAMRPVLGNKPALKIESVIVGPDAVVVRAYAEHGFAKTDLFVEPASLHVFNPPEITPDKNDPRRATLRIGKANPAQNLAREAMGHTLILTLVTKDGAVEKRVEF